MKKIIVLLVIVGIVSSCGTRKVNKSVVETVEVEHVDMMIRNTDSVSTEIQNNILITTDIEEQEITITPIDTSKEINVGGKSYKNVVIKKSFKRYKSISDTTTSTKKDSVSDRSERSVLLNIKEGTMSMKSSEKEDGQSFYMYSFLFLLLLILLLYLINKFKKYLL